MAVTGKWYANNIVTALNKKIMSFEEQETHETISTESSIEGGKTMNYTKGPWEVRPLYGLLMVKIGPTSRAVATVWVKKMEGTQDGKKSIVVSEEGEANAQLIAASPDLYQALNALARHANCEPGPIPTELWEQAERALQKAEGRE